ncbi:alkylation response protein AidB-like acyl-CoA dehydrogenase [Saccharothrix carnea]|uniref:Alkylation response protein AidB-like acyl-CoA dehydrogenase n=1 Tax=Saccharothrix carnea TaxID=1280637 RepID=A0A2P8IBX9_SACCR|nr:acyl-CoA dehydrogenase family protein [Saccharothrix carnea]PSL55963.1 alkylation response protein AidB-like acyl-CoA dehydrogenase [Saccharothrix carnea]
MSSAVLDAIAALAPRLTDAAARADEDRRLADDTVAALRDAGTFRVARPTRYGGEDASIRTHLDLSSAVARLDGGASWSTALWNGSSWITSLYPGQAQDDVWGTDPDALISGTLMPTGTAEPVPGGYRLSGAWTYASGIGHASWGLAAATVEDGLAWLLVPREDFEVVDEWYVAGMKSTGSNRFVVRDAFVPDHRVLRLGRLVAGANATSATAATFRAAFVPSLVVMVSGPLLGLGRAALAHVIDASADKGIAYTGFDRQRDSAAFQLLVAEAASAVDSAELHAYRAADLLDRHAAESTYPPELLRARCRADASVAVRHVTDALDKLMYAHGSRGFADASPLQRIWRDANVAARHGMLLPQVNLELYGSFLVGAENTVSPFV